MDTRVFIAGLVAFLVSVWMLAGAACGVLLCADVQPEKRNGRFWLYTAGGLLTVVYLFYRVATDKDVDSQWRKYD